MVSRTSGRLFLTMLALMAFSLGPLQAVFATPVLQIDSAGQLTGARNVNVNGSLYDVSFVDGTCGDLYTGCDNSSDFVFTDLTTAKAAAQALLDFVFIDGPLGLFDSSPILTNGCFRRDFCTAITPFSVYGNILSTTFALNSFPNTTYPDAVSYSSQGVLRDTSLTDELTYAVWKSAAVPEPGPLWLLLTGSAGLLAWRIMRSHHEQSRLIQAS